MSRARTPAERASELADAFYSVMPIVVTHVNSRLAEYDMNHTDMWALRTIEDPMPMKELAACMDFDPSYVTVVADRLEERGLIERQPHETDRRVKNLALTKKGRAMKDNVAEILWSGPNTFSELTDAERDQLIDLLTRLASAEHGSLAAK